MHSYFNICIQGKLNLKNRLLTLYVEEVYESEHNGIATKRLRVILDAKYEKADLHKVTETQFQ